VNRESSLPLTIGNGPTPEPEFTGYPAFVARSGEQIAGHLTYRNTAPGERELLWLYVEPEWRGRGVAAQLLAAAVAGPQEWFLEVRISNEAARKLYERAGFVEYARRRDYYAGPVEDAILMRRAAG
jgi:[ribosomal protein S18]-alanine N-acetyltransferase